MRDTVNGIKTIVVDLDGTLLRRDKTISAYTEAVLKECKKRGIHIVVATARPLRAMQQYCNTVDFDAFIVSNGARIICGSRDTLFAIHPESAGRLLKIFRMHPDMRVTLETGENAYSNIPIEDYKTIIRNDLVSVAGQEDILKIIVHMDTPETAATVKAALSEELYVSVSAGYMMQIMDRSASKWNGILHVLEVLGSTPAEAAYFGDDHDDVMPIKLCGTGVAVANGIPEVKAVADYIADSNDADGVAHYIEQHLL